jgi:hypothetical protein
MKELLERVPMPGMLDVRLLLRHFRSRIAMTWVLVLIENILWAFVPLFMGRAIDGLLSGEAAALWEIGQVLAALTIVAVGRRIYDTRCYGTMRVAFGAELVSRKPDLAISTSNARLQMGREVVDFLEGHVPELLTSVVQLIVSIAILWSFDIRLGISALVVIVCLCSAYACFHGRFFQLNSALNSQSERQIDVLEERNSKSLFRHLMYLRRWEVKLSDTEAVLYGLIYAGMFGFVLTNLWFAATIPAVTAGAIFAILSYSWQFVESGLTLPMVLQQWTRLGEIRERINDGDQTQSKH